eukprot:scaffold4037_cov265-Chaetoceros_neogracile.AAC.9
MVKTVPIGALLLLVFLPAIKAILPTAAIDIRCTDNESCDTTLFASQASFGAFPDMNAESNEPMAPMIPPTDDPLLCNGASAEDDDFVIPGFSKFVMIVPRGGCTFQQKTANAEFLGASGIIIYGTLASRYSLNSTLIAMNDNIVTPESVVYPQQYYDYDCDKASAEIPLSRLSFDSLPYDYMRNDPVLSGSADQGNICAQANNNFANKCPSERCLLTGEVDDLGENMMACCAWDLHIWLYNDDNATREDTSSIKIPAFYITMAEADEVTLNMQMHQITVTMYRRYYPLYNVSSVVIWALGVFVAALAAWMSASEYRNAKFVNRESLDEIQPIDRSTSSSQEQDAAPMRNMQEESMELTAAHAFGFIIFSTSGLLILFFFQIYNIVKIFYAFGCAGAIFQIIFYPLFHRMSACMGMRDRIAFTTDKLELGAVSYVQIVAACASYGICTIWIYIAFTRNHPDSILFFWLMQDIMGACMCIMFLSTIKLNSIKVAAVLLTAAFFYDIFFVFVTPYLTKEGKSIMVDVATSGGPPTADPAWCEKYPDDVNCQGGDPLPMLFTIPRLFDYSGGSSLLGLGDIVLPGLLLSFGARYDAAKRMIGMASSGGRVVPQNCQGQKKGYFTALVVSYAIGLAMANVAVYVMKMGQPALLYLVPCCLGTMSCLGWMRGELRELWNTPRVLASCDSILYGPIVEESEEESQNLSPIN